MYQERTYPAKLLLFGEHTVLRGFPSLAIPIPEYYMKWKAKSEKHPSWLVDYLQYLRDNCGDFLDISLLEQWIDEKTIETNIPIGYGLGSSGALTAAIFDVGNTIKESIPLSVLQAHLGKMESYFHGKSSGFDPLISYCNVPMINHGAETKSLNLSDLNVPLKCYLLDSGQPRSGKKMIQQFLDQADKFHSEVESLGQLNEQAINIVTQQLNDDIENVVRQISLAQLEIMPYMIVDPLRALWEEGLSTEQYYLKICGAGGGGYYLLFSKYKLEKLKQYDLIEIEF